MVRLPAWHDMVENDKKTGSCDAGLCRPVGRDLVACNKVLDVVGIKGDCRSSACSECIHGDFCLPTYPKMSMRFARICDCSMSIPLYNEGLA